MGKKSEKIQNKDPMDQIQKLDLIDSLKFGKIDAEMRNKLQGLRLCDYEIKEIRTAAAEQVRAVEAKKQVLSLEINQLKPEYEDLVKQIAEKHKIDDPKFLVIDPDKGTVRDSRTLVN